jgi:glutamyl-tRNA(Gln) amidotransferase subunit E
MQDMRTFLKTIENEVLRQKSLSDKKTPTPAEVRNALNDFDCGTEFLRPMPGADRMYPETDLPLLKISRDFINECKKDLPRLRSDIAGELKEKGLSEEMVKLLLKMNKVDEFKDLLNLYDKVNFVAKLMLLFPKEIASKEGKSLEEVDNILNDYHADILNMLRDKKIDEGDVKEIIIRLVRGDNFDDAVRIEKKDVGEVEEKILKIIKEKPGLNANAYMGLVMKEMKGKIDGKTAMEVINKLIVGGR